MLSAMDERQNIDDSPLLTKGELACRLGAKSVRLVDELVASGKIPVIRLGHRTVRFDWRDVRKALQALTVWPPDFQKGGNLNIRS